MYILLFPLISLFVLLGFFPKPSRFNLLYQSALYFLPFTPLIYFTFLDSVGPDWTMYYDYYNCSANFFSKDIFYYLLNCILFAAGLPFKLSFLLIAFVNYFILHHFVSKYPSLLLNTIYLYPYVILVALVNSPRQFLSFSICLLSILAFSNSRRYLFLVLLLIACCVHTASLIIFFAFFILKFRSSASRFSGKLFYLVIFVVTTILFCFFVLPYFLGNYLYSSHFSFGILLRWPIIFISAFCLLRTDPSLCPPSIPSNLLNFFKILSLFVLFLTSLLTVSFIPGFGFITTVLDRLSLHLSVIPIFCISYRSYVFVSLKSLQSLLPVFIPLYSLLALLIWFPLSPNSIYWSLSR